MSGEIFIRGMTDAVAKTLQRPGLVVHREAQPMHKVIARTSLVIHHGGNGTCCAALSGGRPQILLPTHMEARLSADAVVAAGCGRLLGSKEAGKEDLPPILEAVAGDAAMALHAVTLSREIAARGPQNTVERIVAACLAVLDGRAATPSH
jgi:UDP:flavonoid glycosyltransferase YjiC (YdhE family)